MTKGIAGRRPAPTPVTPMASRLEAVRARRGVPSLRAFHARLDEGWRKEDGRVSYEAVRNYHYDRDAPATYLARVAEVFDVRLPYLVNGDGPMTEEEATSEAAALAAGAGRGLASGFLEHIADTVSRGMGEGSSVLRMGGTRQSTIVHTYSALQRSSIGSAVLQDPEADVVGVALGRAIRAPLEALGLGLSDVTESALTEYVVLVCAAIRQLARTPAPPTASIRSVAQRESGALVVANAPTAHLEEEDPDA